MVARRLTAGAVMTGIPDLRHQPPSPADGGANLLRLVQREQPIAFLEGDHRFAGIVSGSHDLFAGHPPGFIVQGELPGGGEARPAVFGESSMEDPVAVTGRFFEDGAAGVDEWCQRRNHRQELPVRAEACQQCAAVIDCRHDRRVVLAGEADHEEQIDAAAAVVEQGGDRLLQFSVVIALAEAAADLRVVGFRRDFNVVVG